MNEHEGRKTPLDGREGLSSYLRYLGDSLPDFYLIQHRADTVDRETALTELREEARACQRCSLFSTRTQVVFGEGNPWASLMFVGEGPGADEDATGRPFVGRAGELLTRMITAMGYERPDVYIANIVKCRPPGNRVPEEIERRSCLPFLHRQISLVAPKAIVLLGQTAAVSLLAHTTGIKKIRGKESRMKEHPEIRVMPTYHPAYLLRNPSAKGEVWEDLKQVMSWLGRNLP